MKQYNIHWIINWVKSALPFYLLTFLPFYLFTFLPLAVGAQGLPLIRNYTAAEYGGHNRNYDIEIGEDGTVYVANFEGLLYYDHARWRILHTSDINRVTVVYLDSKNTLWVGGYNYFARLQKRANGELYLQQIAKTGHFHGEVMEIFEDGGSLQFVASDNIIYEVKDGTVGSIPIISIKQRTNTNFRIGVEAEIVSLEALKEGNGDALLQDITTLNKMDYASDSLRAERTDVSVLVADIVSETALAIKQRQMALHNLLPQDIIVKGNPLLLYSIFRNLVDNAISYAGTGTTIEISAVRQGNSWLFTFSDNGIGIPAEHLPRIFERFYRIDKGRSRDMGGTGLGLSIVKNAVMLHGGHITVSSPETGGLVFEFTLPSLV